MTKEEFRKIENMKFQEVCSFLEISPYEIIAKNLHCIRCPLFCNGCDGYHSYALGVDGWYICKNTLKRFIKTGECND